MLINLINWTKWLFVWKIVPDSQTAKDVSLSENFTSDNFQTFTKTDNFILYNISSIKTKAENI